MRGRGARRGVALPAVVLVLAALGLLSAMALTDALQATHLARYAEGQVTARAAAIAAVDGLRAPDDLSWLCLQPPAALQRRVLPVAGDLRVELRWRSLGRGRVRGEVAGQLLQGGSARLLVRLRVDSLEVEDAAIGCPRATRLEPDGSSWLAFHPAG